MPSSGGQVKSEAVAPVGVPPSPVSEMKKNDLPKTASATFTSQSQKKANVSNSFYKQI